MALLEVKGVTKRYGGVVAVSDVSLHVEQGEIVAVIGPNGAGKTTLFNMITGVIPPSEGQIFFDGEPVAGLKPHQLAARGMTRTFQNLQIFQHMTVLENVMVGRHPRMRTSLWQAAFGLPPKPAEERESRRRAMELLELVGLAGLAEQTATDLPYGKQRLVEIARALATEPRFLLLDEPAAGLNNRESAELAQLILRLRKEGVTFLFVEHDMETVMEVADRIVVLEFGQKIAEGTPREIQRNPLVIAAYLGEEAV